jgi:hypothetical protein
MKHYKSIEEFRKDWTLEKQRQYNEVLERKYGKQGTDAWTLINDRELSQITGAVLFTIPIK